MANGKIGNWFTTDGAASYLGLRPDTIRRYVYRKLIRVDARVGTNMLFAQRDLDEFSNRRRPIGRPKVRSR